MVGSELNYLPPAVEEPSPVADCPSEFCSAVPVPVLDETPPDSALEMATPVADTPPAPASPVPTPAPVPDAADGITID